VPPLLIEAKNLKGGRMSKEKEKLFNGGRNIALKTPSHLYQATVDFYRDIVGLESIEKHEPHVVFEFGSNQLWIDDAPHLSQSEIWLELKTSDVSAAAEKLKAPGVIRRDEIEKLPEGFKGFWISSPSSIIHIVSE